MAVDVARTALRAGSGEVSMFCLESRDIMPAAKDEVAEAEEEGISVNNSWGPKEILTENGKVNGNRLQEVSLRQWMRTDVSTRSMMRMI